MQKDLLYGKKIVLGVTGCIAAYKSAYLIRDLVKRGADVKVVMSPSATQFITLSLYPLFQKMLLLLICFLKIKTAAQV